MKRALAHSGLFLIVLAAPVGPAQAQESVLHAGLSKPGYIVGGSPIAGGLYRHVDAGQWEHLGWNHPSVKGIASDPADPQTLFLAVGNGLLRSRDGGRSWTLTTGWEITEGLGVAVDPNAPGHVYLATAFGLWRSADRGATWEPASEGLTQTYVQAVAVDRSRAGTLLAGTWGGLHRSDDGGRSWQRTGPDAPINDVKQSPGDPRRWLAATHAHGLLRSSDGGRSWQAVEATPTGTTFYAVAFDPFDARRAAAAGWQAGVYLSDDGGRSWVPGGALPSPNVYEVIYDANVPGRLWAATVEHGLYRSGDRGRSWQAAGLADVLVYDLAFIPPKSP